LKKIWLVGGKITKNGQIFSFVLVCGIECGTACEADQISV